MRLKPACSSPISLPSLTGTSTAVSPRSTAAIAWRTRSTGSATERAASTMPPNPTSRAVVAEEDDRRGEPVGGRVADPGRLREPHEPQPEHRRARPQPPGQQDPRGHARQRRVVGYPLGERQLGDRAGDALGEQVRERAGDRAAEHGGDADRDRQPAAVLGVERDEAHARGAPQRGLHQQQVQRHPQRRELLLGRRRPVLAQPARVGRDPAGAPRERERDRDREAGGERHGVREPRARLVGDVGQRQHPREEREDDDRADDVRGQHRRGQRQHDALRDRGPRGPGHAADGTGRAAGYAAVQGASRRSTSASAIRTRSAPSGSGRGADRREHVGAAQVVQLGRQQLGARARAGGGGERVDGRGRQAGQPPVRGDRRHPGRHVAHGGAEGGRRAGAHGVELGAEPPQRRQPGIAPRPRAPARSRPSDGRAPAGRAARC